MRASYWVVWGFNRVRKEPGEAALGAHGYGCARHAMSTLWTCGARSGHARMVLDEMKIMLGGLDASEVWQGGTSVIGEGGRHAGLARESSPI